MSITRRIAWDDMVLPFQLDNADIRGRVARLDAALHRILTQHDYPAPVAALVAEAALLTAMIGQTVKLRWKLSLQIRGDGPIRLIATDWFAPESEGDAARIRAWASFDADRLPDGARVRDPFPLLGRGFFGMLIDQGAGSVPYQGITPLAGGSLTTCAETYFAQSEQLPTRFAIAVARSSQPGSPEAWRGGGVMIQTIPQSEAVLRAEPSRADGLMSAADILQGAAAENWNRANLLLDTAEETELIGPVVTPDALLVRLFHEEAPRVYDAQPVRFGCTCSPAKVEQSTSIYSARDIAHMTTPDGKVTADCQFCGAHYEFDPATLGFEAGR
jgi:molecular chaperone Hsp33